MCINVEPDIINQSVINVNIFGLLMNMESNKSEIFTVI